MAQNSNRFLYWDKGIFPNTGSTHAHILGECQSDFNMSMVMDGTKDSMKVQVLSFIDAPVEPWTIVYHVGTSTYWVIADDKIERYEHEGQPYYLHNLQIVGAIELFGARDLTDCGFNENRYTVQSFIRRLFSLSNFELLSGSNVLQLNVIGNAIDLQKKVDYVKTFENYTLLSALREFLDGYNCCAKLNFTAILRPQRRNVVQLNIYSKTGNTSRTHQMSEFKDVRETKTMNQDSFGSVVVSNAQNVISTKSKMFPSIGSVKLSGETYEIKVGDGVDDACIRLPSPAYKVNWVRMIPRQIFFQAQFNGNYILGNSSIGVPFAIDNKVAAWSLFTELYNRLYDAETDSGTNHNISSSFNDYFNIDRWYEYILNKCSVVLYGDNEVNTDAFDDSATNPENRDDPSNLYSNKNGMPLYLFRNAFGHDKYYVLGNKSFRNGVPIPWEVMYWETGKDLIKGFDFFYGNRAVDNVLAQEVSIKLKSGQITNQVWNWTSGNNNFYVNRQGDLEFSFRNVSFQVNYIPMNDIKIKMSNSKESADTQYYNQNGKLTDSNALSKLMLSYSKEIESTTITKYGTYYSYGLTPKVGDIVFDNDTKYVISNVSYNFERNENYEYIIYGEFTMSQYVATKSLMVNPQTNIRDYNIPQNYNVKRKQVYKDYWELSFTQKNDNGYYALLTDYLKFPTRDTKINEHCALINVIFNNGNEHYYQLDTTKYVLKKSIYEMVDFKDNNIIGYSTTSVMASTLFSTRKLINTPISYVDNIGELKSIYILFLNNEEIIDTWSNFSTNPYTFYNYSICVNEDIFSYAHDEYMYDFRIDEPQYKKDATEVPVFEYCCELGDTNDIIVGENIFLEDEEQHAYNYYGFVAVSKNVATNNNWTQFIDLDEIRNGIVNDSELYNAVRIAATISPTEKYYRFMFYEDMIDNTYEGEYTNMADIFNPETQDLIIYKCYTDENDQLYAELIFIVKDAPQDNIIPATEYMPMHLKVFINHIPKKGI